MVSCEKDSSQPLLSFVIPVYNAHFSIEHCLDSIISQVDVPYEIICVDDGSTDESADMLDAYVSRYANISVLHIVNSGPSVARTRGIQAASGRYLLFVDSDDYFAEGQLKYLIAQLCAHEGYGVYVFGFMECQQAGMVPEHRLPYGCSDGVMALKDFLDVFSRPENISLMNYLFNKVYRADIAKSIGFDYTVTLGEDALYNYECYKNCDCIYVSRTAAYVYENYSDNSLSRGKNLDCVWTAYQRILEAIKPLLVSSALDNRYSLLQLSYAISALHDYVRQDDVVLQDKYVVKNILTYVHTNGRLWRLDGIGKFDVLLMMLARIGCVSLGLFVCDAKRIIRKVR